MRSLLFGTLSENLNPGLERQSIADRKLEAIEGSARNVRRRCTGCYEEGRKQQSRDASYAAAKKVKTLCSECDNIFVLNVSTSVIIL